MNNLLKIVIVFLSIFVTNIFAQENKEVVSKPKVLVGYYGRPNTKSLGILGQSNIDTLVKKMRKMEAHYNSELEEKVDVQMAFHIIYGLATPDAGRRGTYMLRLSEKSLMRFINRAKKENFKVIIDLQMGSNTASEALTPVLKYLKYEFVHLALDPEFKIPKHKRYPPGKFIGHIFAQELNEAQELVSNYLTENNLKTKELIVHMFHPRMLRKKGAVQKYEKIDLIYNVDGHGDPAVKIKIYNKLYTKSEESIAKSGFKIFYHADTHIMTPRQILGWEPTRGRQLWNQPYYINYQ